MSMSYLWRKKNFHEYKKLKGYNYWLVRQNKHNQLWEEVFVSTTMYQNGDIMWYTQVKLNLFSMVRRKVNYSTI